MWWGRADPDGLVDLIRRYQIDVFAAQELGPANAEAIASELPHGQLEPHVEYQGMGIALRHPGAYSRIPMYYRDARRVVLDPADWPGLERAVDLVNVHFHAPHTLRPFPSLLVRRRQARDFDRFLAAHPSETRAVVGDYNSTPQWPLYQRYARRFSDAAILAAQREGRNVVGTWGVRPGTRRLLRIDHALVRGLEVESFEVVPIPGSDHSAVVMSCRPGVARVEAGEAAAADVAQVPAVEPTEEAAAAS
jgi:endonuclease/exonuclease/phosphatase family metal-dependent hydrolase